MNLPSVIVTNVDAGQVLICTTAPYIIAKVSTFRDQDEADDYATRPVTYSIKKIPCYNIFITYAGTMAEHAKPHDSEIEKAMQKMKLFYQSEILPNFRMAQRSLKSN